MRIRKKSFLFFVLSSIKIFRGVAKLNIALDLGSRDREFESHRFDQLISNFKEKNYVEYRNQ